MGTDRPPAEVLTAGPDGDPRPPARLTARLSARLAALPPALPAVLLVILLAGLAAGVVLDRRAGRAEFDRLLSRCAAGDAQVRYEQARLTSVVTYATPLLQRPTGPPGVPQGLARLVQTTATQAGQELTPYVAGVSTVAVLPWHPNLADARTTCATYLRLATDRFTASGQDLAAAYRSQADVTAARDRTRELLRAAAPDDTARQAVTAGLGDGAR
jgi:hypothetical protein